MENRTGEKPPKVAAMYEAVIDLLNEGRDVNRLKVSDITVRAGIGKGTAYEYFSSKEEIIAGAMIYDMQQLFGNLCELQKRETTFGQKVRVVLNWIATDFKDSKAFARIISVGSGSPRVDHLIHEKFTDMHEGCGGFLTFVDGLLEEGRRQGDVKEFRTYAGRTAVTSQIVCLVMYLSGREQYPEVPLEEALETAYENIVRLLRA